MQEANKLSPSYIIKSCLQCLLVNGDGYTEKSQVSLLIGKCPH